MPPVQLGTNMNKLHLDTDFAGDIDDLCALALLLRWPDQIELTGITTVGELDGRRAGAVRYVLGLEARNEVPVAAGADTAHDYFRYEMGLPPEERYWPEPLTPAPGAVEDALLLLKRSIEAGATVIAIGPFTNLYLLDLAYPGILAQARLVLMGGYVHPPRPGFPQWGNEMDFNVQADVRAAQHVLEKANPVLVPLAMTVETALRRAHLDALRTAGALGRLIAHQAEAFALDEQMATRFGATCANVPPDIINFQHDPLACAVALGCNEGIELETLPLVMKVNGGWLCERIAANGKPRRVVTKVDGPRFSEFWVETITAQQNEK